MPDGNNRTGRHFSRGNITRSRPNTWRRLCRSSINPSSMQLKHTINDLGKLRGLQRVTSSDGFFLICALDHLSDFQELLDPDPATVDYQRTGAAKIELIRSLASESTAFLLDARFGLAQAIASRALPGGVGLMASIEDEDYKPSTLTRKTRFREHWSTKK